MSSQTVVNLVIGVAILGGHRRAGWRPRAHLGYDYLLGQHKDIGGLGSATLILYLAVTLGVQRLIVVLRAQRLNPAAVVG